MIRPEQEATMAAQKTRGCGWNGYDDAGFGFDPLAE